jgi:chaperonin GroES
MKITPLGDRVLVRALDEGESKVGGIIIPDTAKEKPQQGEVVAVGPGRRQKNGDRVAIEVKAGDRILYGKYSGNEITIDGERLLVLHEEEILARL